MDNDEYKGTDLHGTWKHK